MPAIARHSTFPPNLLPHAPTRFEAGTRTALRNKALSLAETKKLVAVFTGIKTLRMQDLIGMGSLKLAVAKDAFAKNPNNVGQVIEPVKVGKGVDALLDKAIAARNFPLGKNATFVAQEIKKGLPASLGNPIEIRDPKFHDRFALMKSSTIQVNGNKYMLYIDPFVKKEVMLGQLPVGGGAVKMFGPFHLPTAAQVR